MAAELAEVVGGLAGGVVVVGEKGVDFGGEVGDGEPVGSGGEREEGGEGATGAWFVHVDASDPGAADHRRLGEFVEDAVGDEADVDAVDGGAESFEHAGETATMSGKRSRTRPTPRALVLWATASKRSTCSPLV